MATEFQKNPFKTVGNSQISAWAVGEGTSWIQTRKVAIAKRVAKLDGAKLVGASVRGGYLRIFSVPYALSWVSRNVVTPTLESLNP